MSTGIGATTWWTMAVLAVSAAVWFLAPRLRPLVIVFHLVAGLDAAWDVVRPGQRVALDERVSSLLLLLAGLGATFWLAARAAATTSIGRWLGELAWWPSATVMIRTHVTRLRWRGDVTWSHHLAGGTCTGLIPRPEVHARSCTPSTCRCVDLLVVGRVTTLVSTPRRSKRYPTRVRTDLRIPAPEVTTDGDGTCTQTADVLARALAGSTVELVRDGTVRSATPAEVRIQRPDGTVVAWYACSVS